MVALCILAKKQKQGVFVILFPGICLQFGSNKLIKIKKQTNKQRNQKQSKCPIMVELLYADMMESV